LSCILNFEENEEIIPSEKPVCIIMGEVGSGKTTLFNKVCNTHFEAGWSQDSLTRGLFMHDSAQSNYPFTMIDTPGTNSTVEPMKHAILLKEAFTLQPINAIFTMIPNHNRPA
jgi:GTPase Era involved in 16S rRNA processing